MNQESHCHRSHIRRRVNRQHPKPTPATHDTRLDRFENLLCRFEPVVHAVCRMIVADENEAVRCGEDAFVSVYTRSTSGNEDFTRNSDCFFREALRTAIDLAATAAWRQTKPKTTLPGLDDRWASLSVEDRTLLALKFGGHLDSGQIAAVLNLTKSAARNRLWTAMNHFTRSLLTGSN